MRGALQAISGLAEAIIGQSDDAAAVGLARGILEHIGVARRLLAGASSQLASPDPTDDLAAVVAALPEPPASVTRRTALASDVPPIACDRAALLQILGNLVRNAEAAIEASGAAGTITVSARRTKCDGDVVIAVEDDGPKR